MVLVAFSAIPVTSTIPALSLAIEPSPKVTSPLLTTNLPAALPILSASAPLKEALPLTVKVAAALEPTATLPPETVRPLLTVKPAASANVTVPAVTFNDESISASVAAASTVILPPFRFTPSPAAPTLPPAAENFNSPPSRISKVVVATVLSVASATPKTPLALISITAVLPDSPPKVMVPADKVEVVSPLPVIFTVPSLAANAPKVTVAPLAEVEPISKTAPLPFTVIEPLLAENIAASLVSVVLITLPA